MNVPSKEDQVVSFGLRKSPTRTFKGLNQFLDRVSWKKESHGLSGNGIGKHPFSGFSASFWGSLAICLGLSVV